MRALPIIILAAVLVLLGIVSAVVDALNSAGNRGSSSN